MRKFIAIFIALSQWLAIAQRTDEYAKDCGKLTENYLYSFNKMPAVDEFPWIARVYYEDTDRYAYKCLAVLISKRHLLLPALCVAKSSSKYSEPYAVILGADNQCYRNNSCPSPVPNYYEIDTIALHPNSTFDSSQTVIVDSNIGIITLKSDVSYNAEVRPICLPSNVDSSAHYVGQNLHYAGYAKDFVQPLKTIAYVISLQICRDLYQTQSIGNSYMCVKPGMTEEAVFVAGAPLMGVATKGFPAHPVNLYLVGLAAMGTARYRADAMDVVISVGPHIDWIRYNTNIA